MLQPVQNSDSMNPAMQLNRENPSLTAMRRLLPCAMALLAALLASGCEVSSAPILDPKGPVAFTERDLLFIAAGIMLIVIVPVWIMAFVFVTRYRVKNEKAAYRPDWDFSTPIEILVWTVPAVIVIVLGTLVWGLYA